MMKRVISILLALMLLSGTALAENYRLDITWEADEACALAYLEQTTNLQGSKLQNTAKAYAELARGLGIQMNFQEGWTYLAASLKDTLLLDLGVASDWNKVHILSNLLPGHYMTVEVSEEEAAASEAAWNQLTGADWAAIAQEMIAARDSRLAALQHSTETGSFMGDAYEGGVLRHSYAFDDKDVAALVEDLLAVLEKHGIDDKLLEDYVGEPLVEAIRQKNVQITEKNRFSYILHYVYDQMNAHVGSSLVVLENDQQVMTLSLCANADNGWRLVWGYGLNEKNYYVEMDLIDDEASGGKTFALILYEDPMRMGYRGVEPYADYVVQMLTCTVSSQPQGNNRQWQAELILSDAGAEQNNRYLIRGEHDAQTDISCVIADWYISMEDDAVPVQTIKAELKPCEPMEWSVEGMTSIRMNDDASAALIEELVEQASQELLVKLFKLLPPQILTMFLQ